MTLLAAALIAALPHATPPAWTSETDPFRRTATKALSGEFGELEPWQRKGYQRGLDAGTTLGRPLVLTAYYGTEGSGRIDAHGARCSLRTCASNRIPQYAYVWTPRTGLRQVLDTGSRANDHRAKGGTWVDVWYPTRRSARQTGIDGWVSTEGAVIE